MKDTKKIIWRLKEQPTALNLQELVKNGILSKDEAREILFSSETKEDRDVKSLESEIKFLRELVEKLSRSRSEIISLIDGCRYVYKDPWFNTYTSWCGDNGTEGTTINFSSIQTF